MRPKGELMALQTALPIADHSLTYRMKAVQKLAKFRQEWEEIASGESLLAVTASVGLVLSDIADRLELSPQERYVFLGKSLLSEVENFLAQEVSVKDH
jgi:hypothetical protein